jgi:hypothetical protein
LMLLLSFKNTKCVLSLHLLHELILVIVAVVFVAVVKVQHKIVIHLLFVLLFFY